METNEMVMMGPRTRVNGATLPKLNGRPIILLGVVQQIDSSGQNVKVQASDGQIVIVRLEEPLQKNLEGIIEFHGISQGRQMVAKFYVKLPCHRLDDFDMETYDEAVKLIHLMDGNPWLLE